MKLGQTAAVSDPGRKRRQNEDAFVLRPPLFAIADGMGGARAGEIASALAAGALNVGPSAFVSFEPTDLLRLVAPRAG